MLTLGIISPAFCFEWIRRSRVCLYYQQEYLPFCREIRLRSSSDSVSCLITRVPYNNVCGKSGAVFIDYTACEDITSGSRRKQRQVVVRVEADFLPFPQVLVPLLLDILTAIMLDVLCLFCLVVFAQEWIGIPDHGIPTIHTCGSTRQ